MAERGVILGIWPYRTGQTEPSAPIYLFPVADVCAGRAVRVGRYFVTKDADGNAVVPEAVRRLINTEPGRTWAR